MPFLTHVLTVKLKHYDKSVRELSALALARMAHLSPNWVLSVALPALIAGE